MLKLHAPVVFFCHDASSDKIFALEECGENSQSGSDGYRFAPVSTLNICVLHPIEQRPPAGCSHDFADGLRRAFVFFFGVFVPYFAISRSASTLRALRESMATFCLSCAIMAAIALFETARHWLLYGDIANDWGYGSSINLYITRGSSLRAVASTAIRSRSAFC